MLLLVAAVGAESVEFHLVMGQQHAQLLRDCLLHQFQFVVLELDYLAAAFADEMVVMMLAGDFIARLTLVEMTFGEQVAFLQQLERAVNRRIADVRIDLLDLGVEFFRTDMPPQLEEYARDIVALAGRFQPALAQPRMELRIRSSASDAGGARLPGGCSLR